MKKLSIFLVIIAVLALFLVACDDKNKEKDTQGNTTSVEDLTPEQRVKKDTESYVVDNADFMDRSGYKLTKSDALSNVSYGTIYSQSKDRAQVDLVFKGDSEDRHATLTLDKTDLHSETEEERPDVILIADVNVTFSPSEDGLKTYYYKKGSIYYSFSTYDTFTNEELFDIVAGFNTEIGENF